MDVACSTSVLILLAALSIAYGVRLALVGRARHARVEKEGESAILAKAAMEMMVWCGQPIVRACARLGISPDAVTLGSLGLGIAAGVAFGGGHFGLGAVLAIGAGAGDAVDGLLARHLAIASDAGEVLDAAVDRVVDFALFAGLLFRFRQDTALFVLTLFALLGSSMVTYSTAKADALHVVPPRGSMRRVERVVLMVGAAMLTPLTALLGPTWRDLPFVLALGAIAVLGNLSASQRFSVIRRAVRQREAGSCSGSHGQEETTQKAAE